VGQPAVALAIFVDSDRPRVSFLLSIEVGWKEEGEKRERKENRISGTCDVELRVPK
jgi:hypothetical protein